MAKSFMSWVAAAVALSFAALPAGAQFVSDGYAFLKAVKDRDGAKVQSMVGAPGSIIINTRERGSGESALLIVARDRDLDWLSFLLGRGARPDSQNNHGDTALTLAAQLGWVEGAQELLAWRATVDLANNQGETPLILAVHNRDAAMVRLLLGQGADPKRPDNVAGLSAIDYARQDARAATVLKMLETPRTPARKVSGPRL